ncbi:hypothetical protein D3C85_14410 [compost metagenome]
MSEEQNGRVETILDEPSLVLKARKQDGMEGEPTLRATYYENCPRLVVKTKVPNDRNNGKIEAAMNNRAFFAMLRAVELVANSKEPIVLALDNKGHRFVEKKRDPNPSIMSSIKIEKNAEGIVSINISAGKNRPDIDFLFMNETYHGWRSADGPMPHGVASRLFALGWVDTMREYVSLVIEKNYKRPAWMDRNRQDGGGNGNWKNNNGGNGGGGNSWGNRQGGGNNGGGGNNNWQNNNRQNGNQQQAPQVSGGSDFNFDDDVPL